MDIEHYFDINDCNFHYQDSYSHQEVPFDLYNNQSRNETSQACLPLDQIVNSLAQKPNFVDLPLADVVEDAIQNFHIEQSDVINLRKKIKKKKNTIKRQRAKSRNLGIQIIPVYEKKLMNYQQSSTQKDTIIIQKQIKKQRNRISAQISRDKKKYYVKDLENKNKELSIQAESMRIQNQRLKKMLYEKKNPADAQFNHSSKQKNKKLMRILLMLGLIFFIYILQDIFGVKMQSVVKEDENNPFNQNPVSDQFTGFQSNIVVQQITKQISEISNEEILFQSIPKTNCLRFGDIKDKVMKKIGQMRKKMKYIVLPGKLVSIIFEQKQKSELVF